MSTVTPDTTEQRVEHALCELLERNYGDSLHFGVGRLVQQTTVEFDTSRNHVSMALARIANRDDGPVAVERANPNASATCQTAWTARRREEQ